MNIRALDNYEEKKQRLIAQCKHNLSVENKISLKKESSNLFRDRDKQPSFKLDLSAFNQVISIDPNAGLATIEAMITYENFAAETLQYGCLPAVVPQLKTITVGGAITGLGIESSSFRYGLVHETVSEMEILVGDGRVITCTADNAYQDLFHAFPNSYGTLGYVLKVTLNIVPSKKYIKLTHSHFNREDLFFNEMHQLCKQQRFLGTHSFIDGVIFNKHEMHLTLGEFVDTAPYVSNYTYMDIYYQSIRQKNEDYLTTYDYIWRWDSDWFWCSRHFGMQNKLLRFLLGKWLLHSKVYWKIMNFAAKNTLLKFIKKKFMKRSETVIQDILIPIAKASQFYDFFTQSINITPIWVCPTQSFQGLCSTPFYNVDPSTLYLDFGFWDVVPSDKPQGYLNRKIECKTQELNGFKSLYSASYYTENEFWTIFPKEEYLTLKRKYDPKNIFNGFFEKCVS